MRKKMVIIGAGSVVFTIGLVADLIRNPGKHKWQLSLVDIDPIVLDAITLLCGKMIKSQDADIVMCHSTNRCDVLKDADYVVSTIGVGGRRAWEHDVFIPRKYGVFQPVGDTSMPGGISRAMRMIPAMLDITKDIIALCPRARFFNFSNPMTAICRGVRKATGFPLVGLCHGVNYMEEYIADFAGFERDKFTCYSIGINHLTFMYDMRYEGADAKPLVAQKLEGVRKRGIDCTKVGDCFMEMGEETKGDREPFAWSIFQTHGAFPAPGDRHITEFFTERFPGGKYYGKTLGLDAYTFEGVIKEGDDTFNRIRDLAYSHEPLPEDFFAHASGEHEQLMDIINSIEYDKRRIFSVNIQNNGAVPNLPFDAVLEMPGAATSKGFCALHLTDFPDTLAAIVSKNLAIIEVTVEAALKGDKDLFAEAILMGGYITDVDAVKRMVDELINAQKQYLPQF